MLSGPACGAPFGEISAALASGHGAEAQELAEAGLSEAGLSGADRARLIADRGFARNLQGDRDGALADLTQALDSGTLTTPEQARLYLERGLILDSEGKLDDAVGDYGAALRLAPASSPALNNRANVFRRQKRFEDARRDYLASLAADNPAPEYPYYGLGQIAETQGRTEEAKSFYSRALSANPGYALAAQRLAALGGAPAAEAPITLKPPKGVAPDKPLVLHPPGDKFQAAPATRNEPQARVARLEPADQDVALRPALDNSESHHAATGEREAQLGAWRSEAEARDGWKHAVAQAGEILSGISPRIVVVDLPGRGRFYRLRVAASDVRQFCGLLSSYDVPCIQAPP